MGLAGALVNRLLGKERELKMQGYSLAVVAVVAGGASSYTAYSFVKRFLLSLLLRGVPKKRLSDLEPGDYVKVHGRVTTVHPGAAPTAQATPSAPSPSETLLSPKEKVSCVLYTTLQYRVMEESFTATGEAYKGKAAKGTDASGKLTHGGVRLSKDKWSKKEEVISENTRSLPAYLIDDSGLWVRLDLGGDPLYLDLEVALDKFTPADRQVEMHSSRRTLGYRDVEKVLPLDAEVLVFGEVQPAKEGNTKELVIKRPATRHMFDRKTARTKPWVVCLQSEDELLSKVEARARIDLYIAGGTAALTAITGFFSYRAFTLLAEMRAPERALN